MFQPRIMPIKDAPAIIEKPTIRIDLPVKPSLLPYCRELIAEGHDPETITLVYRGETLCFNPTKLCNFASLTTTEGDYSIRFRRHYAQ